MFKLVVLSAFIAVVAARPSLYESVAYAAPAYTAIALHEPSYAHVGSVVKSVPTAVAHQSHSIVHSSAHVVQDVLAPAVKSTLYTTKSLVNPVHRTYAAPVYVKSIASPIVYSSYAAKAPVWYKAW